MSSKRYTDEFKIEAVRQVTDRGFKVAEVAERLKHQWLASGSVYGHRKVTDDLRDLGERCSRHRVRRLMRAEGLRAQVGYGRKSRFHAGRFNVLDYAEMFYNPKRRHSSSGDLSPVEFERRYAQRGF